MSSAPYGHTGNAREYGSTQSPFSYLISILEELTCEINKKITCLGKIGE